LVDQRDHSDPFTLSEHTGFPLTITWWRWSGPTAPTIGAVNPTLRSELHQRGLRMTPQRQLVLDAVRALGHATPEQICARVQETAPAVNITTVYRTLDLLERIGVVRHTHLGHGAPSYSEQEHQHVHLVCHGCGTVSEVPTDLMDGLAARLRADEGFELDVTHVALSGRCASCREADR
jgi:Fur family transcriptional regulator, ferric uptake regulator